jgi:transposase
MKKNTLFVGLDVHADTISVALAESGRDGQVYSMGIIANRPDSIRKLIRKLENKGQLRVCYEAGPCGYVLYWQMVELQVACEVIAPTLIPQKSGDKVKTDRRDATKLARLYRAGELTPVWVPDRTHEALRDLVRARQAAVRDLRASRHRLDKFLLRNGIRKPMPMSLWTHKHMAWIKTLDLQEKLQKVVFEDYLHQVEHQHQRLQDLEKAIDKGIQEAPEHIRQVVAGLQMLRGLGKVTAVGVVAEVGNFSRFSNPSQLMSYAGSVPSEYSSGGPSHKKQGSITKTGNSHLRRMMTESAWGYRFRPAVTSRMLKAKDALADQHIDEVRLIAWKAQCRLHDRYKTLTNRGKAKQVAITAVGRELLGFVWSIAVHIEKQCAVQKVRRAA